jgi:hypothetical protein
VRAVSHKGGKKIQFAKSPRAARSIHPDSNLPRASSGRLSPARTGTSNRQERRPKFCCTSPCPAWLPISAQILQQVQSQSQYTTPISHYKPTATTSFSFSPRQGSSMPSPHCNCRRRYSYGNHRSRREQRPRPQLTASQTPATPFHQRRGML